VVAYVVDVPCAAPRGARDVNMTFANVVGPTAANQRRAGGADNAGGCESWKGRAVGTIG
jgi:hypothetical protein